MDPSDLPDLESRLRLPGLLGLADPPGLLGLADLLRLRLRLWDLGDPLRRLGLGRPCRLSDLENPADPLRPLDQSFR